MHPASRSHRTATALRCCSCVSSAQFRVLLHISGANSASTRNSVSETPSSKPTPRLASSRPAGCTRRYIDTRFHAPLLSSHTLSSYFLLSHTLAYPITSSTAPSPCKLYNMSPQVISPHSTHPICHQLSPITLYSFTPISLNSHLSAHPTFSLQPLTQLYQHNTHLYQLHLSQHTPTCRWSSCSCSWESAPEPIASRVTTWECVCPCVNVVCDVDG